MRQFGMIRSRGGRETRRNGDNGKNLMGVKRQRRKKQRYLNREQREDKETFTCRR